MDKKPIGNCLECGTILYLGETGACRDWCKDCENDYIAEGDPNF